jgi:hypothetical protein
VVVSKDNAGKLHWTSLPQAAQKAISPLGGCMKDRLVSSNRRSLAVMPLDSKFYV